MLKSSFLFQDYQITHEITNYTRYFDGYTITIYIEQGYFCPWPWGNYGLRWAKETWTVNGSEGHLKFQMFQRLFVERKWQFSSLVTPIRAFIIKTLLCSSSGFHPWCNRLASFYELSMPSLHPRCIQMEMSWQYETPGTFKNNATQVILICS